MAKWWADPRVLQIIQAKFASLPPPSKDKKKKDKKGEKKSSTQRAQSVPPIPQGGMTSQPATMVSDSGTEKSNTAAIKFTLFKVNKIEFCQYLFGRNVKNNCSKSNKSGLCRSRIIR